MFRCNWNCGLNRWIAADMSQDKIFKIWNIKALILFCIKIFLVVFSGSRLLNIMSVNYAWSSMKTAWCILSFNVSQIFCIYHLNGWFTPESKIFFLSVQKLSSEGKRSFWLYKIIWQSTCASQVMIQANFHSTRALKWHLNTIFPSSN